MKLSEYISYLKRTKITIMVLITDLVPLTYVWIPDFKKDFLMFNLDNLEEQYGMTAEWAGLHNPVPPDEFLKPYYREKRKEYE
jgi:hypothetical protein